MPSLDFNKYILLTVVLHVVVVLNFRGSKMCISKVVDGIPGGLLCDTLNRRLHVFEYYLSP